MIKINDEVVVIAGDDRNKTGKVTKVLRKENRVIVEGINVVKKHVKPDASGANGGIIEVERPINISNVKKVEAKKAAAKKEVKAEEKTTKKSTTKKEKKD